MRCFLLFVNYKTAIFNTLLYVHIISEVLN